MQQITTVTQKGQVTIPLQFRDKLKLVAGSKIAFFQEEEKNELILIAKALPNLISLKGSLKNRKKYSKTKARKSYLRDVLNNKI